MTQASSCALAGWGAEGWGVAGTGAHEERQETGCSHERGGSAVPTLTPAQAREVPGVKVFRSSATVYFANAELYSDALKQRVRPGCPRLCQRAPHLRIVPSSASSTFASSAVWTLTSSSPRKRNCSENRS